MYKRSSFRFIALVLGVIFLAAQFHVCADLAANVDSTRICPVCSAAVSVVQAHSPGIAIAPLVSRLEVFAVLLFVSLELPHASSPRSPPAL